MEHTTLHLLYSRFWHKFLYDYGIVPTPEPYMKRTSHGMILGENNEKMSKSRGNVVNPDEIIDKYGADTLRIYEMFIGDFEKSVPWSNDGLKGCRRFADRVWALQDIMTEGNECSKELEGIIHRTIKKVSRDYETLKFNTAIAAMMTLINKMYDKGSITKKEYSYLLLLLNPVAPHLTEELWELSGFKGELNSMPWPSYLEEKTIESQVEIAIQINGKVKGKITIAIEETKEAIREKILSDEKIQGYIAGKTIVKEIYITGKNYNIAVK